jgi:hypothetical protein
MPVPRDLDIFSLLTVRCRARHAHALDGRVVGKLQHRRPEQQVEGDDVLADEVNLLGVRIFQEGVVVQPFLPK